MTKYLIIESRHSSESNDVNRTFELAAGLAARGNHVDTYLVQNAVLMARASARSTSLSQLARAGVGVYADDFSLRERGIPCDMVHASVTPSPIERVLDEMSAGTKCVFL